MKGTWSVFMITDVVYDKLHVIGLVPSSVFILGKP